MHCRQRGNFLVLKCTYIITCRIFFNLCVYCQTYNLQTVCWCTCLDIVRMFVQLAFKWFDRGMTDLEHESQMLMFNSRVLKVDPSMLDSAGYSCLRNFFETINLGERKLKRISGTLNLVSDLGLHSCLGPVLIHSTIGTVLACSL